MKKITVKQMDGNMEEVDLLNAFKIDKINKNFVILSKGESAGEGLDKIYISEVIEEQPGIYKMIGITDDNIWNEVKSALKEIVNKE